MRYIRLFGHAFILGMCVLFCNSCNSCNREQHIEDISIDLADLAVDSGYVRMTHQVFYALPTPIEVSMLLKSSGIGYQASLLNDPANASKYLTNRKKALNFGVYITDLTYSGLFDQTQTVLRYKGAIQQLAEGLGMLSAIDPNTLKRMETNLNNRDEMLHIISETYSACTSYLNEDDRYFLTLAILTGGWIEGMYIATSLLDGNQASTKDQMEQLVTNQKLSFDIIWLAMTDLKDNPDIGALMSEMSELAQTFAAIKIEQGKNELGQDDADKTTTLKSTVTNNITPELYATIQRQVQVLRNNFIQN